MQVIINALSVTNISGRHVLLGHLERIAKWTQGQHQYQVLFHHTNREMCKNFTPNITWIECPDYTAKWPGRTLWETVSLAKLASKLKADFIFTPAGTIIPHFPLPQVSFAQNPWALVKGIPRGMSGQCKAILQRHNYKMAISKAAMMLFNSEYMQQAYRENANKKEQASAIVYQGLSEETYHAATLAQDTVKHNLQILCVSVMAPHKGIETLVSAVNVMRLNEAIPVKLILTGPWPEVAYENKIRTLIHTLKLQKSVQITGHVSRDRLHQLYAESKVFSLMSHCESFGIPAVEAQAFGTPVVSSNCCAIPEVCGEGGVYPDPGDVEGTATKLKMLITDNKIWQIYSSKAIKNAKKYHWDHCSKNMLQMFEQIDN